MVPHNRWTYLIHLEPNIGVSCCMCMYALLEINICVRVFVYIFYSFFCSYSLNWCSEQTCWPRLLLLFSSCFILSHPILDSKWILYHLNFTHSFITQFVSIELSTKCLNSFKAAAPWSGRIFVLPTKYKKNKELCECHSDTERQPMRRQIHYNNLRSVKHLFGSMHH